MATGLALTGTVLLGAPVGFIHETELGRFVALAGLAILIISGVLGGGAWIRKRRAVATGELAVERMKATAHKLVIAAVILPPLAFATEAFQISAIAVGFLLGLAGAVRALAELTAGRLRRDWRPWTALALCTVWPWVVSVSAELARRRGR